MNGCDAQNPFQEAWRAVVTTTGLDGADPAYKEYAEGFQSLPWRSGHIHPKNCALISLAVNATATQMHADGARRYMRLALQLGATAEDVVETLQLVSTIGIHACVLGIPLLLDEIDSDGAARRAGIEQDPRRVALRDEFVARRGYWNDVWDGLLWLDPEYFRLFLSFSAAPWQTGSLEPKIKEFIYIAVDVTTTHLFALGAQIHIRNALRWGASPEEIMTVLQLASAVGLNACAIGGPILATEAATVKEQGE